jgi:hypothetical protein
MSTPGRLEATFAVPKAGVWEVWLQGQIMPAVAVAVDGHRLTSIGGQLGGNSLVPNTITPIRVFLSGGSHRLSVTPTDPIVEPGGGGSSVLFAIFLTPATGAGQQVLRSVSPLRWRTLCGRSYEWVEAVRSHPRPPARVHA